MEMNHEDHGDALANRSLLNSFIDLHRSQLELTGVPQLFYPVLFHKLQNQVYSLVYTHMNIVFENRFSMPVNILE